MVGFAPSFVLPIILILTWLFLALQSCGPNSAESENIFFSRSTPSHGPCEICFKNPRCAPESFSFLQEPDGTFFMGLGSHSERPSPGNKLLLDHFLATTSDGKYHTTPLRYIVFDTTLSPEANESWMAGHRRPNRIGRRVLVITS